MSGPLDGVVVIDLGQVYNGPYCTMLLSRLGADVIKVEPPGGEPVRVRAGERGESHAFSLLNGGKRGIVLDLKQPAGRSALLALAAGADVLVENFAPGVMSRLGLDYDVLHEVNPRLVVASGKGYATAGPYREFRAMDLTVQAMTGVLSATGFPDAPPVKSGAAVADFAAGAHLAVGILAALHQRERTGGGQFVEVAMQDATLPMLTSGLAGLLDSGGTRPERTGNRHGGMAYCPYNVYPAADGWIAVLCLNERHWQRLCDVMDRPDLARSPAYADNAQRVSRMADLDLVVAQWTERTGARRTVRATTARRDPGGAGAHARRGPGRTGRASRRHGGRRRRPTAGRSLRVRQPDPVRRRAGVAPGSGTRARASTRARSCERWACDSTVREALTSVSHTMSGPDRDHVTTIVIDVPSRANAISEALARQMTAELAAASDDERVRAVVITATGTTFCSGADLRERAGTDAGARGASAGNIGLYTADLEGAQADRGSDQWPRTGRRACPCRRGRHRDLHRPRHFRSAGGTSRARPRRRVGVLAAPVVARVGSSVT